MLLHRRKCLYAVDTTIPCEMDTDNHFIRPVPQYILKMSRRFFPLIDTVFGYITSGLVVVRNVLPSNPPFTTDFACSILQDLMLEETEIAEHNCILQCIVKLLNWSGTEHLGTAVASTNIICVINRFHAPACEIKSGTWWLIALPG